MKKFGLMLTVSAMIVAVPPAPASPRSGSVCRGTRAEREIGLRVHRLSCRAADASVGTGNRGFRCRTAGQTRLIPYTIKCVRRRHRSMYYSYDFFGG